MFEALSWQCPNVNNRKIMQIYVFFCSGNCKPAIAVVPGWNNFYLKMHGLRSVIPHQNVADKYEVFSPSGIATLLLLCILNIIMQNLAFPVVSPLQWNGLSLALCLLPRVHSDSFCAHLKTVLFCHEGFGNASWVVACNRRYINFHSN